MAKSDLHGSAAVVVTHRQSLIGEVDTNEREHNSE
jgi:hypothetical protein